MCTVGSLADFIEGTARPGRRQFDGSTASDSDALGVGSVVTVVTHWSMG